MKDLKEIFPAPILKPFTGCGEGGIRKMENLAFYDETMKLIVKNTIQWWRAQSNQEEAKLLFERTRLAGPKARSTSRNLTATSS